MNPIMTTANMNEKGEVQLMKAVGSLEDLVGIGEKSFKRLGGGEKFLKNERAQWPMERIKTLLALLKR
jgi:hypothetical protein